MILKVTRLLKSTFIVILFVVCNCFTLKAQIRDPVLKVADDTIKAVTTNIVEESVSLLYGAKKRKYITGAISSIEGDAISNVPGSNRLNTLAGRLAGYAAVQVDGVPGYENSNYNIRGAHTFGSQRIPQVLIDGRPNVLTMLDPYDIESIVILKDAATTVLYGLRSTNGIILINTKKGKEGRSAISVNSQTSFQQPTRLPKFLDAYNYALLYNEAQLNDNPNASARFNATALEAYRTGSDPYRYPNVNWVDEFLKDYSVQTRNSVHINGGGKSSRYFVSGTYLSDNGLFNVDKDVNSYNTNSTINALGTHSNIEVNINKKLTVFADLRAKKDKRNAPGAFNRNYDETVFSSIYGTPFSAHPIKNEDGSVAGTNEYRNNPYALLNNRGYSVWEETCLAAYAAINYDLGSLVKGLKLKAETGFTNINQYYINRIKSFEVSQLNADGTYSRIGAPTTLSNTGFFDYGERFFDQAMSLHYSNTFGLHHIDALLRYDRQQIERPDLKDLTQNFQGPKAGFSYVFNSRYIAGFAFSYQGNERYPDNKRYGFFPAASAGWILSEENFLKQSAAINFLKLRASYGTTGNHINNYFDYLSTYASGGNAAVFGTSPSGLEVYYQSKIANNTLTWEKSTRLNAGLDLILLRNRFNASIDYFSEKNSDILIRNAVTMIYGAMIDVPQGKFANSGIELTGGWTAKAGNIEYAINANLTHTKNKISYQNETIKEYPWMYATGNSLGTRYGYVFDRFFTESDDIKNLPDQSLLGAQRPGDLKYKDLNNDGIINEYDITRVGYAKNPEINYGITMGLKFKAIDLNILFHGTANSTTYNSGATYWEFAGRTGNVQEHHLSRWQPGSGQSAGYPRLTLSNTNNFVTSSYWVSDNSFLRLKYMEIGYTVSKKLSRRLSLQRARLFVSGSNLYLWDNIEHKDPEIEDNGLAYPLQRAISVGINLNL